MWDAAQDTELPDPFPVCSEAPRCGDLGEQQKPSGRLQGKLRWNSVTKWRGERKVVLLVIKPRVQRYTRACFL